MTSPIPLAGCLIFNHHHHLLLLHRHTPGSHQWEIPGGKVKVGETSAAAATREIREELGVQVKIAKLAGTANFSQHSHSYHYSWFLAHIVSGVPTIKEPDIFDQYDYFSWSQLQSLRSQLSPNTQNLLHAYLSHQLSLS